VQATSAWWTAVRKTSKGRRTFALLWLERGSSSCPTLATGIWQIVWALRIYKRPSTRSAVIVCFKVVKSNFLPDIPLILYNNCTLSVSSNWPTTSETLSQVCAVSCRVSSSRWRRRWRSTRTSVQMTQHARPRPCCSECIWILLLVTIQHTLSVYSRYLLGDADRLPTAQGCCSWEQILCHSYGHSRFLSHNSFTFVNRGCDMTINHFV